MHDVTRPTNLWRISWASPSWRIARSRTHWWIAWPRFSRWISGTRTHWRISRASPSWWISRTWRWYKSYRSWWLLRGWICGGCWSRRWISRSWRWVWSSSSRWIRLLVVPHRTTVVIHTDSGSDNQQTRIRKLSQCQADNQWSVQLRRIYSN